MIYVVLGMHKSGTTLVAEILHASGINMGAFEAHLDYDKGNKLERHETQAFNRQFLHGLLLPPLDYLARRPFQPQIAPAGYERNKDSLALVRQGALRRRLAAAPPDEWHALIARCQAAHADWGFKDPRTCLTYPAWRRALPAHRVIVVYRHVEALVRRYRTQGWRRLPRLYRTLYAWTLYNRLALAAAAGAPAAEPGGVGKAAIVLNYERLMDGDEEFARLAAFVGRPLVDRRRPDLYRRRPDGEALPPAARLFRPLLPEDPEALWQRLEAAREGAA